MSLFPNRYDGKGHISHWAEHRHRELYMESLAQLELAWSEAVARLRAERAGPERYLATWQLTMRTWDASVRPAPFGLIDAAVASESNLAHVLQATGIGSYGELHAWSVADPEGFWTFALDRLGVLFRREPQQILETDGNFETRRWFPGAQINCVETCLRGSAEAAAIYWGTADGRVREISLSEVKQRTRQIAVSLRRHGFVPGTRLAILMPMTPEAVFLYLGLIYAGCVVVSIADSFAPLEIGRRLQIANASALFVVDEFRRAEKSITLYERVCQATDLPAIVLSGPRQPRLRNKDMSWDKFLIDDELQEPHRSGADGIINILFSSGTTGDPKAIPWTQTTPIKSLADGHFHQDIHPGDVVAWPTNLGWMMGPWLIFASLGNQASMALYEEVPTSRGFAEFIAHTHVTMLGVVPTIVKSWRDSKCAEGLDWSSIRCFSSTGEASNPDDMCYLSALAGCKPIIEYCGGTEIGGGFVASSLLQSNVPGMFSCPTLGSRFVLLDSAGQAADQGELYLIPPALGMSQTLLNRDHHATYYAGAPQGPQGQILRRHGDYFQRLAGDYYVAGGRVDDTMNLGGIKVSSAELERVLNRVKGVRETAAVAIPPSGGGPDELIVFAVPDGTCSPPPLIDQLRQEMNLLLRRELNPLFRVIEVVLVESLPRTASNKVMRRELRAQRMRGDPLRGSLHEPKE